MATTTHGNNCAVSQWELGFPTKSHYEISCVLSKSQRNPTFLPIPASPWGHNGSQFSSVAQSCPTLCNPMNRSTSGLTVHHQLLEYTQTHVHWVGDAIQPSHPLSSLSPPAFNLSQHQSLFKWVTLHIRWPKYWSFSFNIIPSNEYSGLIPLGWIGWISLSSRDLNFLKTLKKTIISNTTVQTHQFFSAQPSL